MKPVKNKAVDHIYRDSLYFSAAVLARQTEKLAIECWKPAGLPPSHGYLLLFLLDVNTTGPSILAKSLFLSPSTITRFLEKLEKKDLVRRFIYDGVHMVQATHEAAQLWEVLIECDVAFDRKCRQLLEDPLQICKVLNQTTDTLLDRTKRPNPDSGSDTESRSLPSEKS